jgi:hypothetical protein
MVTGTLTQITAGIAAIGALGTAASGLVDATKVFGGGISNIGIGRINQALRPFNDALTGAVSDWKLAIRANWINGKPKEDQKAAAKSLIRLGLSSKNAATMAEAGHVDATALTTVLTAIETGAPLSPDQVNLLGRFNGAIDAVMDAGFEEADQQYRNAARLLAGVFAVGLSVWGAFAIGESSNYPIAILIGLIAVPLAPVAKDLTSSLQAAVTALKSVKS